LVRSRELAPEAMEGRPRRLYRTWRWRTGARTHTNRHTKHGRDQGALDEPPWLARWLVRIACPTRDLPYVLGDRREFELRGGPVLAIGRRATCFR
jgi:hypothetical protein